MRPSAGRHRAMNAAQVVDLVVTGVRGLIALATALGARDAALAALDSELVTFRAGIDAAIEAKHRTARGDEVTRETSVDGKPGR